MTSLRRSSLAPLGALLVCTLFTACASTATPSDGAVDARSDASPLDARDATAVDDAPDGAPDVPSPEDATLDASADSSADAGSDASGSDSAPDSRPDVFADAGADASDASSDSFTVSPRVTINEFSAFANCMPIVAPDPIRANWRLNVTSGVGAAATVVSATLTLRSTTTALTQTLVVTPTSVALVGGGGTTAMSKTTGTPMPTNACRELCNAEATLVLDVDAGRGVQRVTATDTLTCAL